MATFPLNRDPVTGGPRIKVTAAGNETVGGMTGLLSTIRRMEEAAALPEALKKLEATSITGIRGRASQVIEDVAGTLSRAGHRYRAELMGTGTVRFNLLGHGIKGPVSVGASFDLPLEVGGVVRGLPSFLADPSGLGYQDAIRRSEFIGRGRYALSGGALVPETWMESVGRDIIGRVKMGATTDQELRQIARSAQGVVSGPGYENLVWAGYRNMPLGRGVDITSMSARGYQARAGSIFDLFQMGTIGVHRETGAGAGKLISEFAGQSKFPFYGARGQEFDPSRSLQHIYSFLEEAKRLGVPATDRAIKAEAALAGNLGIWSLGEIVPFGETGDPARQAYQRLAIAQLAGRRGKNIATVSTPVVEAMKSHMTKSTGGSGRWSVESRVALVLDPRFEQAVAGSGGGAIITPGLQRELIADITQMADIEQGRWEGVIKAGGRAVSPAEVGSNVILSTGSKHTIAGIQKMQGARMAIGWSTFLKGKSPEAMREAVIRDVLDQMIQQPRAKTGKYTQSALADRLKFQRALYSDIGSIFNSKLVGVDEGIPQLQIGPDAAFSSSQLEGLSSSIDRYNRSLRDSGGKAQELGLREIRKGFEISYLKTGGMKMRSMFINASVMRRLEASEIVTKAVGNWVRPAQRTATEGFKEGVEYFVDRQNNLKYVSDRLYHPRGIKMGLKDITNLELYKTQEASQLAELYTKYIKNWSRFEKVNLASAVAPFFGQPGDPLSAMGFPDIKGAVDLKDFASKNAGKYSRLGGPTGSTIKEMAGTIFDVKSPFRRKALAVKLPWEIGIGGVPNPSVAGEIMETIPTRQIMLPALESYRGILKDPDMASPAMAAYVGKLERAHERLFLSLASTEPNKDKVEANARKYYNLLGQSFGGKQGMLSYLTTARMAHSGYFGLVPGGVGPAAQALGTALDNPFMAQISESSAKQMGVYDIFKKKGPLYGRVTAYPGIGPTMETILQFKMVSDSNLGAKRLRLSNLASLTMFRDFDADKSGVTFLVGERAQHLSKAFYEKTVVPRMRAYQDLLGEDPELSSIMGSDQPLLQRLSNEIQGAKQKARASQASYFEMLGLAEQKTRLIETKVFDAIQKKYTTKALTGPVNWYLSQFRMVAKHMQNVPLEQVGGVLGLIEQQSTITKAKGVAAGASGLFRLMSTQYEMNTEAGRKAFGESVEQGAQHLFELTGAAPEVIGTPGEAQAIASSLGGRGEHIWLSSQQARKKSMEQLLNVSVARNAELQKMGAGLNVYPELSQLMAKAPEESAAFNALGSAYAEMAARQAALSGEASPLDLASREIAEAGGLTKSMGLEWGVDVAGVQARANAQIKAERVAMSEINQAVKTEGRAVGMTVLDRATQWWTRSSTPYWQKAGVITGAAIVLGAIAKNALLPGYDSGGERMSAAMGSPVGPPPVILASPPVLGYDGPSSPPSAPQQAHKKPGGLWAYTRDQIGFGPESYGVEGRGRMPLAKPTFGGRVTLPGLGLDVGPGIAYSDDRPMILAGPPVGDGSPLPPAIPSVERHDPEVPYTTPIGEPPARVKMPDYMTGGLTISARQPASGFDESALSEVLSSRLGGQINVISDRWDPSEGIIDRMNAEGSEEMSSFA